ncbi:hypothetical protein KUL49_23070 [Alteromonas sp. KUL49]|nr:hypothetical protein KUL49_23070 [Alteromonas sp. KUL49]
MYKKRPNESLFLYFLKKPVDAEEELRKMRASSTGNANNNGAEEVVTTKFD